MSDLNLLFNPRSIAIIGASNHLLKWGFLVLHNVMRGDYKGRLYPINKKEDKVFGIPAYPDIKSVGDDIDVAAIIIPARSVPEIIEECGESGVKFSIIISGGFGETGEEGKNLEREVVKTANKNGMRIVGPNTKGMYSSSANLVLLMPPLPLRPGNIAFTSESGILGTTTIQNAIIHGLGFSRYVSVGNQADIKFYEYIQYFAEDPETDVILTYNESGKGGKEFMKVGEEVT